MWMYGINDRIPGSLEGGTSEIKSEITVGAVVGGLRLANPTSVAQASGVIVGIVFWEEAEKVLRVEWVADLRLQLGA